MKTGYFLLHYNKTVEKTETSDYKISSVHDFSNYIFKFLLDNQSLALKWKKSERLKTEMAKVKLCFVILQTILFGVWGEEKHTDMVGILVATIDIAYFS